MPVPAPPTSDTETLWLTDGQLATWRGLMNLIQRLPAALECQLQADSQLSFLEYYVLALLADQPGRRLRMSELAAQANAELSRVSHLVNRLIRRGLLKKEPDPDDGRYTFAILTDTGLNYQTEAAPGHVRRVRELFIDVLGTEDLDALRRTTDKMRTRLDSETGGGPRQINAGT